MSEDQNVATLTCPRCGWEGTEGTAISRAAGYDCNGCGKRLKNRDGSPVDGEPESVAAEQDAAAEDGSEDCDSNPDVVEHGSEPDEGELVVVEHGDDEDQDPKPTTE